MPTVTCPRPSCSCPIPEDAGFELEGVVYCDETCARECTEDVCTCVPCDCSD